MIFPRALSARRLRRFLRGRMSVSRLLRLRTADRESCLHLAHALLHRDRIDDARRLYELAKVLWPERVEPYLGRGVCLQLAGEWEAADLEFTRALEIDPDHPHALADRAEVRILMGRLDSARTDLDRISPTLGDDGDSRLLAARIDELRSALDTPGE
ncbi:MAG: tetratricopeptide repeat protein [Isosphaeraceae bacterium]|nr:tetratricopeptide repeat protein [Isosphaeraceae bacterium]